MGVSIRPYSPDNPFAGPGADRYSPDNPFAKQATGMSDAERAKNLAAHDRMKVRTAYPVDQPDNSDPGLGHRFVSTVLNAGQGNPGVRALEAGAGAMGSHVIGDHPMSYRESLATLDEDTGHIPAGRRFTGRMLGGALSLPFVPGGAIKGGAVLGAADAALGADPESAVTRVAKTAGGAMLGAAGGAVLHGAGNLAQRTGMTDKVGAALRAAGSKMGDRLGAPVQNIGEAIGTTGAVNRLAQSRQDILDRLQGSEKGAAQTMIDHVDATKAKAKTLYDAARADGNVVNDPRVMSVLGDHRVGQMFQVVRERLGLGPNDTVLQSGEAEVPRLLGAGSPQPEPPSVSSGNPASTREAIDAFQRRFAIAANRAEGTGQQQTARAALERRSAETSLPRPATSLQRGILLEPKAAVPEIVTDLPSPEELAMTKRLLSQVIQQKFNAPQGISAAEAAQLSPLLDQLRGALHDASPAWKEADTFYAQAKNFESVFQKAYGAQVTPTASGLDPAKLKTQQAIDRLRARKAGTPIAASLDAGQQAGTAARIAEQVRHQELGPTAASAIKGSGSVINPFAPEASAYRRPAFGSTGDANDFTQLLAKTSVEPTFGKQTLTAGDAVKPWNVLSAQNPLATAKGAQARAAMASALGDPSTSVAVRQALARAKSGQEALSILLRAGLLGGNAMASR